MINIIFQNEIPNPDSMPAVFTTHYMSGAGSINILSQLRIAYIPGTGLWLDMTKFEREPFFDGSVGNSSCAAFSIEGSRILTAAALAEGNIQLFTDGTVSGELKPLSRYKGEDEQGWYFGVRFIIGEDILSSAGLQVPFTPDAGPDAGFFSFQKTGERSHFGSSEPVFSMSPFDRSNLAPSGLLLF